jgi:hypothetical protein
MKTPQRSVRRDSLQQHVHTLPDGHETQGQTIKPSTSSQAGFHAHLYDHENFIYESSSEFDIPGHTHDTLMGTTSGPKPVGMKPIGSPQVEAAPLGEKV